jgi:antitoxin HicB
MRYHFKTHKEKEGFWAECVEIPGCVTQADTKEELLINMEDAINTYLQEPASSDYLAPLPKRNIKPLRSIVEVSVDPEVAFGFLVRYQRIKLGMTQQEAAERLGYPSLYSYQRLEKKCNASISTIAKLTTIFPKLSIDRVVR